MKRKKVIAAVLIAVMSLTAVLGGCGKTETTGNTEAAQGSASPEDTDAGQDGSSEGIKIELVTGDNVTLPDKADNFLEQALKDALGFEVTLNILGAGADYATALNARISGGDVPDLFVVPGKDAMYQYAKNGVILGLNEYKDKIQPLIEWGGGEENLKANMYEGELYLLPKKVLRSYSTWVVRQDWLDKVGAEIPTTVEEALEVARKLTFEDPDGNGKDDTYGFSSYGLSNGFDGIMNPYGASISNHFIIVDGEVTSTLLQPHVKEGLEMCKRFVDAGVVDPDIVANDSNAVRDKMIQGKVGMSPNDWANLFKGIYMDQVKEVNPDANWVWFDPLDAGVGEPATYVYYDVTNTAGTWCIGAKAAEDPAKLDAIFKLLNYMTTEEGQRLVCYGIEGRHYNLENGEVVKTDLMTKECDFLWPYQIPSRDDLTYLAVKFPEAKEVIEFAYNMDRIEVYDTAVIAPEGFHKEDMDKYIQDNMISFIYGQRPIDEYDQFIEELNTSFQFNTYLESARQQLQEKGYVK